jgi:hypothetical protein
VRKRKNLIIPIRTYYKAIGIGGFTCIKSRTTVYQKTLERKQKYKL